MESNEHCSKCITIEVLDNGGFVLKDTTGDFNKAYADESLTNVLEDIVMIIRNRQIKITKISDVGADGGSNVVSQSNIESKPEVVLDNDTIVSKYLNGGIGPRIDSVSDVGLGHGVGN